MKRMTKKNQAIIAILTLMIAVAGYLSLSGRGSVSLEDSSVAVVADTYEAADNSDANEKAAFASDDEGGIYEENIELNSDQNEIGEAVLTSTVSAAANISMAKLSREQSRSISKESYLEILNDDSLSEEDKKSARDAYVKLTDAIEKESSIENILTAKGFTETLCIVGEQGVEVQIVTDLLTEEEKVQIEDILTRNTGFGVESITISLVSK